MKKRRYWIRSVYVKYILLFVGIVWFSSGAAFAMVSPRAIDTIRNNYTLRIQNLAAEIQDFCTVNSVNASQVADLLAYEDYEILIFSDYQTLHQDPRYQDLMSVEQYQRVMSGVILTGDFPSEFQLPYAGVRAGDELVLIRPRLQNNMIPYFRSVISEVLLICAGLGSMLIAVASMAILRPVRKLTEATKEVAKGNFDVYVPVHSADEIGQLTENFNIMTAELKNIEYLRKDFISNVSHEFKTPITSIQGFTRLIHDRKLTDEQFEEYTGIILSESGRLANLSTNLLRLSSLENQAILEKKTRYSLDEQIRRAILILEARWSKKNIEFDLDLDNIDFLGHEELMQQVWINLVSNAVKFSYDGGTIRISLKRAGGRVIFQIADQGIGIPDEAKPQIFDRFFKADKSRSEDGNGLGLAIVKKIVEVHQGKVSFESEAGKGTTFTVELREEASH